MSKSLFNQFVPLAIATIAGSVLGPGIATATKGLISEKMATGFIGKTVAGLAKGYAEKDAALPKFSHHGRSVDYPSVARIESLKSVLRSSKFAENFYGESALKQLSDATYVKAVRDNNLLSLSYELPKEKVTSAPAAGTISLGSERLS